MNFFHTLYSYNEDFDFFDDSLPDNYSLAFGDQLSRARKLLKKRSRGQINYIIESLDWMLKEGDKILFEHINKKTDIEGEAFHDRVKSLKSYSEAFDITNQENLPNATWTDYFATLSLVTILEALHPDNFPDQSIDHSYPMEAMEAVCIAEFYNETAELNKNDSRKSGKAGGNTRAHPFEALKVIVLTFYRDTPRYQNPNLSNKQAAKLLLKEESLKNQITKILTSEPEQIQETIAKWIGNYKYGKYKNLGL
ncbi:MAG: hypothetical protein COB62_01155 [Piscirickettsiaceae bacterium]|nr:MAG: hypothetical protein COB62_01155 [Piscirickettsiaceae bacterium]